MTKQTIAAWNIYFSWKLINTRNGALEINPKQQRRATNVSKIIDDMDADVLGVIEGMSTAKFKYYCKHQCPQYDGVLVNKDSERYTLALLYKKSIFKAKRIRISTDRWKAKIGDDRRKKFYKFTRPPLVVELEHQANGTKLTVAVIHFKSKRPNGELSKEEQLKEAVENRKRIVAEGLRIRELMMRRAETGNPNDRYMIMGDVNDGVGFDDFEKQIFNSGIETLLGSVLDPDKIYFSAIDLSNGRGEPTSSFANGSIQLDHVVHTKNMVSGSQKPKVVKGSGKVRSDLVNIKRDGKRRDSDHAPVQIEVDF